MIPFVIDNVHNRLADSLKALIDWSGGTPRVPDVPCAGRVRLLRTD